MGLFCAGLAIAGDVPVDDRQLEDWFNDDIEDGVPQVGKGELVFLSPPPTTGILHSINTITIDTSSLKNGWVRVRQCYQGLDAVPEAEVVYQYRNMRQLRILSKNNIGRAFTRDKTVQLIDVQPDATLCIQAQAQILYAQGDGAYVLRNGHFHRRFLDGYFPLHVRMAVEYPAPLLRFTSTSPEPRPGFEVEPGEGVVHLDTWFAGTLGIEVHFSVR